MTSRLSALAALFAIVTTASLAYAANVVGQLPDVRAQTREATQAVVLPRVEVIGHRDTLTASN